MHYYQFNIADYRKRTGHLSLVEHAVYRTLLDTYYLEEKPLSKDHATTMRTHCIRSADEQEAYKNVLADFFIEADDGFHHEKCDAELAKIYAKSEKARQSAIKRWAKGANALRTDSERNANGMLPNTQHPIPNNPTPKKKNNGQIDKRFIPPSSQEVESYIHEKGYSLDAESFVAHYESNGWKVGRNKMKSWKAACTTWAKRDDKPDRKPFLTANEKMAQSMRDSRDPVKAMDF